MSKKLEVLGFEITVDDEEILRYTKNMKDKGETHITFYHEYKLYVITLTPYKKNTSNGVPANIHEAITEQLKELGWLNNE